MLILGIILSVLSAVGINAIWAKNEWRYPIFEVTSALERETNPKDAIFHASVKTGGTRTVLCLFAVYVVGAGIIYWRLPRLWVLIVVVLVGLLLLKGVIGLFQTAYSRRFRLLNYLYSPYVIAWRRDHWSEYTDEQVAAAICSAAGIDFSTLDPDGTDLDAFLLALCRRTRPQHEISQYPSVLQKLHAQAADMVWGGGDMAEERKVFRVGKLGVEEEVGEFVGRLSAKAVGFTLLVIAAGVVMLFRDGLAVRATTLVAGGVLSLAGLITVNRTVIQQAAAGEIRRGWAPMLKVFGGFLPYLFGCYLFFFEGVWQIIRLFWSFSRLRLVAALVFLVAGHALVTACYRISEFARGLSEGKVVIEEAGED